MIKKIFFKTVFSKKIGTGHFYRTINLAKSLSKKKVEIYFIVNQNSLKKKIAKENLRLKFIKKIYLFKNLKSEIKFLSKSTVPNIIIDDPNFSYNQQIQYKKFIQKKLFLYQDTPKKNLADVIINHNYIKNFRKIYNKLSKNNAHLLVGIKYFQKKGKKNFYKKVKKAKKIHIFFGGLPNDKILKFVLNILSNNYNEKIFVNCFLGIFNKKLNHFKRKYKRIIFHKTKKQSLYLKSLNKSDLFIGSGGTSLMESLIFGIPSLIFCTAKNQLDNCENFNNDKSIVFIKDKKVFKKNFINLFFNSKNITKLRVNSIKASKVIGSINLTNKLLRLLN